MLTSDGEFEHRYWLEKQPRKAKPKSPVWRRALVWLGIAMASLCALTMAWFFWPLPDWIRYYAFGGYFLWQLQTGWDNHQYTIWRRHKAVLDRIDELERRIAALDKR